MMAEVTPASHPKMIFATVALALIMMAVDITIVSTALDALQNGLNTTVNWVGWTITAYAFGYVLMMPVVGRLSEHYGRRRVFLVSVVIFTVASLCCGLATNIYLLIALRVVQAAGGSGFTPSATGIVVDYFGPNRDRAVSLFGSIFPIGAMLGPVLGGVIITLLDWRWIFFVNVPIGLLIVWLSLRYIPADRDIGNEDFDTMNWIGMVLLGGGVFALMIAASNLGEPEVGLIAPGIMLPIITGVLLLWAFVCHTMHAKEPFIAPHLVYGKGFGVVNLFNAVFGGVILGAIALVPLYAVNRYGMDVLASGTLLTAQGLATIFCTVIAALLLRYSGYRVPLFLGAGTAVAGLVMLATVPYGLPIYWWLVCATVLVGAGGGILNPASRNAGLQLAPEHSSTLAALRSMCLQLGQIMTISIATAVIARAQDPGIAEAWFYLFAAGVIIIFLPLITFIPEHRGAW